MLSPTVRVAGGECRRGVDACAGGGHPRPRPRDDVVDRRLGGGRDQQAPQILLQGLAGTCGTCGEFVAHGFRDVTDGHSHHACNIAALAAIQQRQMHTGNSLRT